MPQLYIIVSLMVLIVVHELGHFLSARAVGVSATKFYLFFGPAIWKRQVGDVEVGVGSIPLGGYVKLPGMFEPQPEEIAKRVGWELAALEGRSDADEQLTLDAAVRTLEKGADADDLVEPLGDVKAALVTRRARLADPKGSEARRTDKAIERVQGMLDDCAPNAYWRADLWRRMVVIFAGPLVNVVVAFALLFVFYTAFIPKQEFDGAFRVQVAADTPAADAGLDADSRVTAWNGSLKGLDRDEVDQRIQDGIGKPVEVSWKQPGDDRVTTKTIEPTDIKGDGSTDERIGVAGFLYETHVVGREGVAAPTAAKYTLLEMRDLTWGNIKGLGQLVYKEEVRENVGGLVGIVDTSSEVHAAGLTLRYVGLISLVLAVMNLLPLLPLDGGHMLFGFFEWIRRKPLPRMAFERYSMVGLALVLVLFFIGLNNDIGRING